MSRSEEQKSADEIQIKVNLIAKWLGGQKGVSKTDLALFSEVAGTMRADHFDSEVLSGLQGFISSYHDIPIINGKPAFDKFDALTNKPVFKGFWTLTDSVIKDQYQKKLNEYYCNTLSSDQRIVFDEQVKDYKSRKWYFKSTDYFSMLESLVCKVK